MGYNRQLKRVLPPSSTTSVVIIIHCLTFFWTIWAGVINNLDIFIFFSLPSLSLRMSMHPGSWLRFTAILAAVFTFFTVVLLQVNTCVRSVAQFNTIQSKKYITIGVRLRAWKPVYWAVDQNNRLQRRMIWGRRKSVCTSTILHSHLKPLWEGRFWTFDNYPHIISNKTIGAC